jgi:CRP/FNR family transcriptional regulator, polysaccharide utilization system transcription regulator
MKLPEKICCNCTSKSPLFKSLSDEELSYISQHKIPVSYKAGETIVKQHSPLTHVISFTSGMAKVYIEGAGGKNLILHFLKPTQFLGGPGIYIDRMNHFSVTAIEDSSVCFIEIAKFKELMTRNCDFAESFIKYISNNGIFNYDRFISLTQKNMQGRVADALLHLHYKIFDHRDHIIKVSRYDLAEYTSMSKDSLIRILKEFTEEDLIETANGKIKILELEKITNISQIG